MKKYSLPAFVILAAALVFGLLMIQKCEPDSGMFRWNKENGRQTLVSGKLQIGFLEPLSGGGVKSKDKIEQISEGVFRITRVCTNLSGSRLDSARLILDFVLADSASFLMIPAVSYQGNAWGRGQEPKGYKKDGTWWSFSYSRSAIPAATYSESGKWAVALWGELDNQKTPFSSLPSPSRTLGDDPPEVNFGLTPLPTAPDRLSSGQKTTPPLPPRKPTPHRDNDNGN